MLLTLFITESFIHTASNAITLEGKVATHEFKKCLTYSKFVIEAVSHIVIWYRNLVTQCIILLYILNYGISSGMQYFSCV